MSAMMRAGERHKISASGVLTTSRDMLGHVASHVGEAGPYAEHKTRLQRGNVFAHWGEGGKRLVYVTKDLTKLAWKKEGATRAKDVKSVALASIRKIEAGRRPRGHKRGTKEAHADRSFYAISGKGSSTVNVDLEASTTVERERWVESLTVLVEAAKDGTLA
jgi:hypothetical protein